MSPRCEEFFSAPGRHVLADEGGGEKQVETLPVAIRAGKDEDGCFTPRSPTGIYGQSNFTLPCSYHCQITVYLSDTDRFLSTLTAAASKSGL